MDIKETLEAIKNNVSWYSHKDKDVVILSKSEITGVPLLSDIHEKGLYELNSLDEETLEKIKSGMLSPSATYDDTNADKKGNGEELLLSDVRNVENQEKLAYDEFITKNFFEKDLIERELKVSTTSNYDWISLRKKTEESMSEMAESLEPENRIEYFVRKMDLRKTFAHKTDELAEQNGIRIDPKGYFDEIAADFENNSGIGLREPAPNELADFITARIADNDMTELEKITQALKDKEDKSLFPDAETARILLGACMSNDSEIAEMMFPVFPENKKKTFFEENWGKIRDFYGHLYEKSGNTHEETDFFCYNVARTAAIQCAAIADIEAEPVDYISAERFDQKLNSKIFNTLEKDSFRVDNKIPLVALADLEEAGIKIAGQKKFSINFENRNPDQYIPLGLFSHDDLRKLTMFKEKGYSPAIPENLHEAFPDLNRANFVSMFEKLAESTFIQGSTVWNLPNEEKVVLDHFQAFNREQQQKGLSQNEVVEAYITSNDYKIDQKVFGNILQKFNSEDFSIIIEDFNKNYDKLASEISEQDDEIRELEKRLSEIKKSKEENRQKIASIERSKLDQARVIDYGRAVPDFAMMGQNGLEVISGYTITGYGSDAAGSVILSNEEGKKVIVTDRTLKTILEEDFSKSEKPDYEKLLQKEYDDFFKPRNNTSYNFRHNLSVYSRKEANSAVDALRIAKELTKRMTVQERNNTKKMLKSITKPGETINQTIIRFYNDAIKEVPLNENYLLEQRYNNIIARPMYDTISTKGDVVDNRFDLRIGDKINNIPFATKKVFGNGEEKFFEDCTIISSSVENNTIVLMDDRNSYYEVQRDSFLKDYAKKHSPLKQTIENIQERKFRREEMRREEISR